MIRSRQLPWLCLVVALLWADARALAQLRISDIRREADGTLKVRFPAQAGAYYVLRRGTVLPVLNQAVALKLGAAGELELADTAAGPATGFYRVSEIARSQPEDTDGDGIDDVYELERSTALSPLDASDAARDPDGNGQTHLQEYQAARILTTIAATSPNIGESEVAVTRETVLRFSAPLAADATLDTARLFASYSGRKLLGRVELASDRRQATLFYQENLPASARVRVTLNGNGLVDVNGRDVDADGDGEPGGLAVVDFDTLSTAPLLGTAVIGKVFASELQANGLGGFVNRPLKNVTITVDGAEETLRTTTDENGAFRLSPAPAGRFFVHVDGRTAEGSNWPGGAYYPFIGKAWEAVVGVETNLAGGTGEIFLPLIAAAALQPVSTTQDTIITFPPETLAANPALAGVEILVPANSLYADNGTRGGKVGIAPVPPDRLPEPLPPGLNLPLVITIQTDGPSNFDRPVPVRFPNLPDPVTGLLKQPGDASVLWSFSHDTGRWEPVAPMTVSADGKFVETDPGFGVLQPGWHGEDPTSQKKKFPCPELSWTEGLGLIKSITDCAADLSKVMKVIATVVQSVSLLTDTVNLGRDAAATISSGNYTAATLTDLTQRLTNAKRSALELVDTLNDVTNPLAKVEAAAKCLLGVLKALTDIMCNRADCLGSVVKWVCGYASPAVNMANQFLGVIENARKGLTHGLVAAFCASIEAALESSKFLQQQHQNGGPVRAGVARQASPEEQAAAQRLVTALENLVARGQFLAPAKADLEAVIAAGQPLQQAAGVFAKVAQAGVEVAANAAFRMVITPAGGGAAQVQGGSLSEVTSRSWSARIGSSYELQAFYPAFGVVGLASGSFPSLRALAQVPAAEREKLERQLTEVSYGSFQPASGADADGDGVPDFVEAILGTDPNRPDTDRDGLADLAEMIEGRDALAPQGGSAGLQTRVELTGGTAVDVAPLGDRALVALDAGGLAVLDVPSAGNPTVLTQLPLPGRARRVAGEGNFAAVTLGTHGLAIVDLTDPAAARLLHQVVLDGAAWCVTTVDGVAYVGTSTGKIQAVHLATGTVLSSWPVSSDGIADLAVGRDVLFAVSGAGLTTLRLGEELEPLGFVSLPGFAEGLGGLRRVSAGGGLAYVTLYEGFAAVDVSDPTRPFVVGPVTPHGPNSFKQILPTGTGLGIAAVGANPRDDGTHDVYLYDLSQPANTANFSTVFRTPGIAYAVALQQGRVFIADGAAGFAVLNPVPRDAGTQAPTVSLQATFPLAPAEAEEGSLVALTADARDDVMVRAVEFFVDGESRLVDGAYPFEFRLRVPSLAAGTNRFTVRVRAVDTGGHETWSELLPVEIFHDLTPPRGRPTLPTAAGFGANLLRVGALFNEPMDPATLTPETFQVIAAGPDRRFGTADDVLMSATVNYAPDARLAELHFPAALPPGFYQAQVLPRAADLAGNRLRSAVVWNFEAVVGTDTDGDGLTDDFELANGLNAASADQNNNGLPDAREDFDNDGLSNGIEMLVGTSPLKARTFDNVPDVQRDQDGDFLPDFREIGVGTDRLRIDTDGDGWNDEIEVTTGADPVRFNRLLPGIHTALTSPNALLWAGDHGTASEVSHVLRLDRDAGTVSQVENILRNGSANENGAAIYLAEPPVEVRPEGFGASSALFEFWPDFNPLEGESEPAEPAVTPEAATVQAALTPSEF